MHLSCERGISLQADDPCIKQNKVAFEVFMQNLPNRYPTPLKLHFVYPQICCIFHKVSSCVNLDVFVRVLIRLTKIIWGIMYLIDLQTLRSASDVSAEVSCKFQKAEIRRTIERTALICKC
jgi:hypothetical protein